MPMAPRRTRLAKPSGTPPTMAVPQSGPISSRPRRSASRLSATSSSSDTWSENTIASSPSRSAFIASAAAYSPGQEISASVASGAASTASARLRGRAGAPSPPGTASGRAATVQRAAGRSERPGERLPVTLDDHQEVVRAGLDKALRRRVFHQQRDCGARHHRRRRARDAARFERGGELHRGPNRGQPRAAGSGHALVGGLAGLPRPSRRMAAPMAPPAALLQRRAAGRDGRVAERGGDHPAHRCLCRKGVVNVGIVERDLPPAA